MKEKAEALMGAVYTEENKQKIEDTRMRYTVLCQLVLENLKDSREKSLALTALEESCMWAIKSITREDSTPSGGIPTTQTIVLSSEDLAKAIGSTVSKESLANLSN